MLDQASNTLADEQENERAVIGGNNPPDPLDEVVAQYADHIEEAQNWLDGQKVEDEGQMEAVDALLKDIKAAKKDVNEAREAHTKPLHKAWQDGIAKFKPTLDDMDRMIKGLASLTSDYKQKLAREKAAAARKAAQEAEEKRRAAEALAAQADKGDIDAQREADAAMQEAKISQKEASAKKNDRVKGLRTIHHHEIEDHNAALRWIAENDRDALVGFINQYCAKNFRDKKIPGVQSWTTKEAY